MSKVNKERIVNMLCEFVKVPSESPNDQDFITYLEKIFGKMPGSKVKKDAFGSLIVKIPAKNSSSKTSIAFSSHADTVKPGMNIKPIVEKDRVKSSGDTVLGADDKAGIAEIIEMLNCAEKHPPIEVVIFRCEEPGCFGAINMDYSLMDSKIAYVLDADSVDEVIIGGPTAYGFEITYKGKSAHAGMAPEKGISSILAASKAISRLRLGKLDEETTANVGTIHGGEIRNGVPALTKIEAECRSLNHEKGVKLADEMEAIFKQAAKEVGAEVIIDKKLLLKAYLVPENSDVVNLYKKALIKNGIKPKVQIVRGGSDATHMNAGGVSTALIGAGYRNNHTCEEYALIDEMEMITKVMVDMVEGLA